MDHQPMPNGGKENVFEYVRNLLNEREAYGVKTYGQPLMTHDGRDNSRDELEEMVDEVLYKFKNYLERQDFKRDLVTSLLTLCPELTDEWLQKQVTPEALIDYVVKKYQHSNYFLGGFWE